MSASNRLQAAVVGAGFMGPQHVDAIRRAGHADVVALVGTDLARTRAAARALGVPRAESDLDVLLHDEAIDVVHVCTPNHTHVALATAVLDAGKHLVVEKPIATDRAGAAALLAAAARSGRHAAVALTYRGYPMVRRARELVRAGRIGQIRLVHGGYIQDWLADAGDYNWRLEAATAGPSRAVADIGTHFLDVVEFITGLHAEAVLADLATFVPVRHRPLRAAASFDGSAGETEEVEIDTEDAATMLIRFGGGARGAAVISQVSPGHKNSLTLEIAGSERSLAWAQEDPELLWLRARDESVQLQRAPSAERSAVGVPSLPAGHPEGWAEALRDLLGSFYATVAAGTPVPASGSEAPYPTLADGARGIALIDAALASARAGAWAPIEAIEAAAPAVAW